MRQFVPTSSAPLDARNTCCPTAVTYLRIARQTLSISRHYLCTIERCRLVALGFGSIGAAGCGGSNWTRHNISQTAPVFRDGRHRFAAVAMQSWSSSAAQGRRLLQVKSCARCPIRRARPGRSPRYRCRTAPMWNADFESMLNLRETNVPHKDDQRHRQGQPNRTVRCSLCDGEFGLIRHYRYRTALCSIRCVERFQLRRESDSRWLWRFELPERRSADRSASCRR